MRIGLILIVLALQAIAEDCLVLVHGVGCRTRQIAVAKRFEMIPGVRQVVILPRTEAHSANQRYLLIRSTHLSPDRKQLVDALGKKVRHYRVLSVAAVREP